MQQGKCWNCVFFRAAGHFVKGDAKKTMVFTGYCRFFPPHPRKYWPTVIEYDVCSRFVQRPAAPATAATTTTTETLDV